MRQEQEGRRQMSLTNSQTLLWPFPSCAEYHLDTQTRTLFPDEYADVTCTIFTHAQTSRLVELFLIS